MTTAEGGMVTTDNEEWANRIKLLRTMGVQSYENQKDYWLPYHYDVVKINGYLGTNYRMNEISAAFGRAQLRKLDSKLNRKRIEIGRYLNEKLDGVEGIAVPYEDPNCKHVYYLYTLRYFPEIVGASKDDFIREIYYNYGIQPIIHYKPNYLFTIYKELGYKEGLCPITEAAFSQNTVNLPIHPRLTPENLDYIADSVKKAVEALKKNKVFVKL
jgi:dTDP-4-amino-4,6-dideoxygalactose transaminase